MARHRLIEEVHVGRYGRHSIEARAWNFQLGASERPRTVKELLLAHAPHLVRKVESAIETSHRLITGIYDRLVAEGLFPPEGQPAHG